MTDSSMRAALGSLIRHMNEFRIFAHGEDFNPDAYLASTELQFDRVWRKGENGDDHPKSNGIAKVLGDGQQIPLFDQETMAIEYLSANSEALKVLAQYPGVTTFKLGLQYNLALGPWPHDPRILHGTIGRTHVACAGYWDRSEFLCRS